MKPIQLDVLCPTKLAELEALYRTTRDVRLRTRAQIILLAAETALPAPAISLIVRESAETVRRWMKRYMVDGIQGLQDGLRPGAPEKVTPAYVKKLIATVRRSPCSLDLPYSTWTLRHLANYMACETGIRVNAETVRLHLKDAGIVLTRQHTGSRVTAGGNGTRKRGG
jgi:transposase